MAKKYISKYTGPEIDSGLDNIPKLEGKLTELESKKQYNIWLDGKGEELVKTYIHLDPNAVYKLSFLNQWNSPSGSFAKLYLTHRNSLNELIYDIEILAEEEIPNRFTLITEDSIDNIYTLSIRANKGESAILSIEAVSFSSRRVLIPMEAGYFGNSGYLKGAISTDDAASRFFKSYYNTHYYKVGGRCKILDIKGLDADQKVYIYGYNEDFTFKTKKEWQQGLVFNSPYIRFAIESDSEKEYSKKNISCELLSSELSEQYEGYRGDNVIGETIRYFSFEIDTPQADNVVGSEMVGNKTSRNFTNGYILLPKNYSRDGKPCKLAIHCHGTNGYPFELNNLEDERVKWLAACGYAVVDCSPYGWLNYKKNPGNYDGNMPNALALACYTSLYRWVCSNYNVEKEVYIYGKSAGGLLATTFGGLNTFPIKAIASIAGSVSSVVNMMCVANTRNNNFLREVGCKTPNVSSWLGSTIKGEPCSIADRNYVLENYELIKDYDPLLYHLIGVDKVKMLSRMMEIGFNHFSEDSELNDIISNGYKAYHYPIKIWHAIDDENVPFATSKWYQQLINNAGGMCFLREFPENTGKHYIDAPSHEEEGIVPTVEYTTPLGETITMSVVYAEMIDWFNRW